MWKWIVLVLFLILIAIIVWSMLRGRGGAQQVTPPEEEAGQVGPAETGGVPAQGTEAVPTDTTTHHVETTNRRADEPYDQTLHEEPVAPVPEAEAPAPAPAPEAVPEAQVPAPEAGVPAAEAPTEPAVAPEPAVEPQAEFEPEVEPQAEFEQQAEPELETEPEVEPETAPEGGYGQRYADGSTDATSDAATDFAEPAAGPVEEPVQEPGRGTDTGQTPATAAQDLGDHTAPSVGLSHAERGYGEGEPPAPEAPAQEQAPTAHAGSEGMGTTSSGSLGTYRESVTGTQHEADLGSAGSGQLDLPTATPLTPGAEQGRDPYGNALVEQAPPAQGRHEQPPLIEEEPSVEQAPPEQTRYEQPPLVEEPPVEQAPIEEAAPIEQAPIEEAAPELAPVEPGPYGPGSAEPDEEGAGPAGWTVKGNAGSMLFHTEDSPSYGNRADVWFESEDAAKAAGFKHWDRKRR